MKKLLLSMAVLALAGSSAVAQEEPGAIFGDYVITRLSPNGKWAVNENPFGAYSIINLQTLEESDLFYSTNDPDYKEPYKAGLGNSISNTGVAVASDNPYTGNPIYFENGVWIELSAPETTDSWTGHFAQGITPDASRICGHVNNLPVIWNRNDDGTYSEPVYLPCPEKDFFGLTPQYHNLNYISADGKTIAGQYTDNVGGMHIPVLYTEDENGKWSYTILGYPTLYGLDGIELPQGVEYPEEPYYEDYMTAEELAAYEAALEEYYNDETYSTPYPIWKDYASERGVAAFEAAYAIYEEVYTEFEEYMQIYYAFTETAPYFEMNAFCLSPNGRYYATNRVEYVMDSMSWYPTAVYIPALFDTTTGEYTEIKCSESLYLCQVFDDGTLYGVAPLGGVESCAYIYTPELGNFVRFEKYYETEDPALATWITENLTFSVLGYEETPDGNYKEVYSDKIITGNPYANEDRTIITAYVSNSWDYEGPSYYTFAYFPKEETTGINTVETTTNEAPATYYNLQGMRVDKPENGVFIVVRGDKATKQYIK